MHNSQESAVPDFENILTSLEDAYKVEIFSEFP